jgi:hypothetical protein
VAASLTWLDVSADQQRQVRDLIRLFEEPGTRDELGIGPVRDAFSELMFPGTSVIQTRARYFLFVPWHFQDAARRGLRGQALLQRVDRSERQLIERFRKAGLVDGLIGRQAGARVKTLPSTIYWSGLDRLGVLASSMTPRAVAALADGYDDEGDELSRRRVVAWHPTLPPAPASFPNEDSGGFDLTQAEASWLQERILDRAEGTLLAHLVCGPGLGESGAPWQEPSTAGAPDDVREVVEQARRFSSVMLGAALLYNLMVSDIYEAKAFTRVDSPVATYRELLDEWADGLRSDHDVLGREWPTFWLVVARGNARVPQLARTFIETWVDLVRAHGPTKVADADDARRLVAGRVSRLRGGRSVLVNEKLLATWGGSSGASPLVYRWGTVRRLVGDIQEGLDRASA